MDITPGVHGYNARGSSQGRALAYSVCRCRHFADVDAGAEGIGGALEHEEKNIRGLRL